MNFDEFNNYLVNISKLEFDERNVEIQQSVTRLKGEMNSRGILNSSVTLLHLSEFFVSEFIVRCEFIKNFIIGHASKLDLTTSDDHVTKSKTFFQHLSTSEKYSIEAMYDSSITQVVDSLQSDHPKQLRDWLQQRIDNSIVKNNLYVELEFKAISDAKSSGKEILALAPNLYGMGIDLKELWSRFFKGQAT